MDTKVKNAIGGTNWKDFVFTVGSATLIKVHITSSTKVRLVNAETRTIENTKGSAIRDVDMDGAGIKIFTQPLSVWSSVKDGVEKQGLNFYTHEIIVRPELFEPKRVEYNGDLFS